MVISLKYLSVLTDSFQPFSTARCRQINYYGIIVEYAHEERRYHKVNVDQTDDGQSADKRQ